MTDGRLKAHIRRLLPSAVRPHRILSGPLRGFRIVTSWHDYPAAILGRTERALLDWFERNVAAGETWLDVGAHYGYTAIALSRLVGSEGRVFAFEPTVATSGYLARTRAINNLNQLTVIPCGLGTPDALELRRIRGVRGMADSTIVADGQFLETVMITRLDWLWERICGGSWRFHGLKIDVQGMEIDALRGMAALLKRFTPKLVIEFHRGVDRHRLLDLLESFGYSRVAVAVEPAPDETEPRYLDDRSYYFNVGVELT